MSTFVSDSSITSNGNFNAEKFEQVLHYIISKTEAFPNVGKKVLYKLLYFIDFNYYELKEEKLTGEVYSKLEHGPAPRHFNESATILIKEGLIEEKEVQYYGHTQKRYRSLKSPKLTQLSATELEHINETLCRYGTMNGSQIEALSHTDLPWVAGEYKDNLDYELVFYRSPEMSVRDYCNDRN